MITGAAPDANPDAIAREANASNNAMHQPLRHGRWQSARDGLWRLIDPYLAARSRVAVVGAGSGDDVPLQRITERATSVDLIDFDPQATARARARIPAGQRTTVNEVVTDVTGGAADLVLRAARDRNRLPKRLSPPDGPLGSGEYDLVIGDMLYTQLLHAGLIALGIRGTRQHALMRRYDPPLVEALVRRIQASVVPGGYAVHVHDVACWSTGHAQPCTLDAALADPDRMWQRLRRHDACDPHLVLHELGIAPVAHAWWHWPFEPRKAFLVRATVASGGNFCGL